MNWMQRVKQHRQGEQTAKSVQPVPFWGALDSKSEFLQAEWRPVRNNFENEVSEEASEEPAELQPVSEKSFFTSEHPSRLKQQSDSEPILSQKPEASEKVNGSSKVEEIGGEKAGEVSLVEKSEISSQKPELCFQSEESSFRPAYCDF